VNNVDLVVSLLVEYQIWAGGPVCTLERAKSVVGILTKVATRSTKPNAVAFLVDEGWCDTKASAKKLGDAVWKYRNDIERTLQINYIKEHLT
jgi:hypothetical protein